MAVRKYNCPFPEGRNTPHQWLYAIGLSDGRVKVGRTGKPRERAIQHTKTYGDLIVWFHMGPCLGSRRGGPAIERSVLNRLAEIGERIEKSEVFRGLSKATAISVMRSTANRAEA